MPTVLEVKAHLKREFCNGGETELEDIDPSAIFSSLSVSQDRIAQYLVKTPLYDSENARWTALHQQPSSEDSLCDPFMDIIGDILHHFKIPGATVLDTRKRWLTSEEEYDVVPAVGEDGLHDVLGKTSPHLCVMGTGDLFKRKDDSSSIPSYLACVSPIELQTEKLLREISFHEVMLQIAVYARQCFNHQPNRRFVCSMMATEANFRLLVFDRVGVIWTRAFNIHLDAPAFVRTVLGVSSFIDEHHSCFDTAIKRLDDKRWSNQYLGMSLRDVEPVGQRRTVGRVSIVVNSKPFMRKAIRGRGTRCWYGITNDDEHSPVVVKEAWRSKERNAESDLLKRVANLDGVAKMLYHSKDTTGASVSQFRKLIFGVLGANSLKCDRIFSRIVMEAYGPPIHHFQSPMQLLCALRDAVAGHGFLWEKGILHRDVSVRNILLGRQGAGDGNKGVLIDLDMAVDVHNYDDKNNEPRAGTRAFQSLMVLTPVVEGEIRPPQDHLDDLESFFYVLMWICMLFVAPGKMAAEVSNRRLLYMDHADVWACLGAKQGLLNTPLGGLMPWILESPIFNELIGELARFLRGEVDKKNDIKNDFHTLQLEGKMIAFPLLEEVHQTHKQNHHKEFLKHLNTAIAQLQADPSEGPDANLHPYSHEVRPLDEWTCDIHHVNSAISNRILKRERGESRDEGEGKEKGSDGTANCVKKRIKVDDAMPE